MKNMDIRNKAKASSVKLWEIAEKLGLQDSNFSRKLRRELSQKEKDVIFKIIDDVVKEK